MVNVLFALIDFGADCGMVVGPCAGYMV